MSLNFAPLRGQSRSALQTARTFQQGTTSTAGHSRLSQRSCALAQRQISTSMRLSCHSHQSVSALRSAPQQTIRPISIRTVHSQPTTATASNSVAIPIDGKPVDFSSMVLRDLCQCPACVHESTNQRLYSTAEVPPSIKANEVHTSNKEARITWQNDAPGFDQSHETILPLNTLRRVADMGARPNPHQAPLESRTLWGAKDPQPPDTTFADYLRDDKALYNVMRQLRQHGLVFISEIPHFEEALEKIAKRMGPMKDTFYGYTWDVRTVPSAINAAYTSSDLGFHTDLLYFSSPPHIQLLHCIQSSSAGGASVFADAFKSAVELFEQDREAFDVLSKLSVNYHYHHPEDNVYFTTKTVFEFNEEYLRKVKESDNAVTKEDVVEGLEKMNWGPPFMAPFTLTSEDERSGLLLDGSSKLSALNEKVSRWHGAAQKFSALLHRPESLFERLMKPGECVLFDNTRVLHARRGFVAEDVGKPRWLKGGYVDKDPWVSKYRVLREQFGDS